VFRLLQSLITDMGLDDYFGYNKTEMSFQLKSYLIIVILVPRA